MMIFLLFHHLLLILPSSSRPLHRKTYCFRIYYQCRIALWMPSSCCSNESSRRFDDIAPGGVAATAVNADRLFRNCLHTTRSPAGFIAGDCFCSSVSGAGDGDGTKSGLVTPIKFRLFRFPVNFNFSPYLFETRTYRGLTFFRYLCIVSVVNFFSSEEPETVSFAFCFFFIALELLCLLNKETIGTSSSLYFTAGDLPESSLSMFRFDFCSSSSFFCSSFKFEQSDLFDFDFLNFNIITRNFVADFVNETRDCSGFELISSVCSTGTNPPLKNSSSEGETDTFTAAVVSPLEPDISVNFKSSDPSESSSSSP